MFKSLQQFCAGHIALWLPRDGLYHAQRPAVQGGPDGLVSHGAHSLDRRGHVQVPPGHWSFDDRHTGRGHGSFSDGLVGCYFRLVSKRLR